MRLEREWELEEAKFTSKLFKNAVFKGGGSGGGQSTNTVQKADPWAGQQPFLKDVFQEAQDRYNQGDSPSFFPGSTIAGFNPNELAYQQNVLNQFGSGNFQNMQQGAEGAVGNLFAGNDIYNATGGLAPYGQESLVAASNLTDSQVGDTTNASPLMQQMLSGSVQQNPFIEQANNAMAADAVSLSATSNACDTRKPNRVSAGWFVKRRYSYRNCSRECRQVNCRLCQYQPYERF